MEIITDCAFQLDSDTIAHILHIIDIHVRGSGGNYVLTSVARTFPKSVHVLEGRTSGITDFDVSAGIIRVPLALQGISSKHLFTTA